MDSVLKLGQFLFAREKNHLVAFDGDRRYLQQDLCADVAWCMQRLEDVKDQKCALVFGNSYFFVVALLSCLYSGKIPVLLGTHQESIVSKQDDLFDLIMTDRAGVFDDSFLVGHAPKNGPALKEGLEETDFSEAYILMYTSGSTGQSKEVKKFIWELDAEAVLTAEKFRDRIRHSILCSTVYPNHLYGLTFRIFMPLATGTAFNSGLIHYTEQLSALGGRHTYALISTPAFLKRIDPKLRSPDILFILSAGGKLDFSYVKQMHEWCGCFTDEIYGSTESGVIAHRYNDSENKAWDMFDGIELEQQGEEFILRSPIVKAPMELDDRIMFCAPRSFMLLGRRDKVIKIEDQRVSLTEIRDLIMSVEETEDCEVVPVEKGRRASLGAVVVLKKEYRGLPAEEQEQRNREIERKIQAYLHEKTDAFAVPRYFVFVSEIPVNQMNKRVYTQLQELFYAPR